MIARESFRIHELHPEFVTLFPQDHLLWDASRAPDERRLQQLVKASGLVVRRFSGKRGITTYEPA